MIKKMLLAKTKKQLDTKGLGHLPAALETMFANPKEMGPVVAYVLLDQCGIFDSLGFYFFFSRVVTKLFPKPKPKGTNHASSSTKQEEKASTVPLRSEGH